jgi:hypothetical protein
VSRKFKGSTSIDENILPTLSGKFDLAKENELSFDHEVKPIYILKIGSPIYYGAKKNL